MGSPFEFVPSDFSLGGVDEIRRMFHAACPASHSPGLRPTRGSGDGFVADTIGVTGFGIVVGGAPAGAAAGAGFDGAAGVGAAGAGAAGAGAAGAGALGCVAGGFAVFDA